MVLAFDLADGVNDVFLMLVMACLLIGLLVVPRINDTVHKELVRTPKRATASRMHTNGTGKRMSGGNGRNR